MPPLRKWSANTDRAFGSVPHAGMDEVRLHAPPSIARDRRTESANPAIRRPTHSRRHRWLSRTGSAPEKRGGRHGGQRKDWACVNSHIGYRSSGGVFTHRVGTKRTRRAQGDGPSDRRRLRQRHHPPEPSGRLPGASCGRDHVPYQPPGLDRRLHG